MKKILISAIALLCFSALVYAVPNYNNGNGTIMFESEYNGVKTVIRKCELEVTIGDLLRKEKDRAPQKTDRAKIGLYAS